MNQHYLFYVRYYEELYEKSPVRYYKELSGINYAELINNSIINTSYQKDSKMPFSMNDIEDLVGWTTFCFPMKVCYPGLLAGLGYQHEAGEYSPDKEQEIKLGCSLDYVSGLPYIPGSTLKGILRSAFRKYDTDIGLLLDVNTEVIHALENAIFEEGQDIFLDVFPVAGDKEGRILGLEYITSHEAPHTEASDLNYDGLTKINPLRLLKIRPEVTILVRLLLQDTCVTVGENCYELTSEIKKELFMIILERYGVGAKTNTGYGHIKKCDELDRTGEHYYWLSKKAEKVQTRITN